MSTHMHSFPIHSASWVGLQCGNHFISEVLQEEVKRQSDEYPFEHLLTFPPTITTNPITMQSYLLPFVHT